MINTYYVQARYDDKFYRSIWITVDLTNKDTPKEIGEAILAEIGDTIGVEEKMRYLIEIHFVSLVKSMWYQSTK